ncbi:MAG: TRAP transporter small permease [Paracoccus sp. (in: a-proteobacteria)]|nr:TRAP transporter small permease [Paracoccus sp. (in: a-proteobacteria)]
MNKVVSLIETVAGLALAAVALLTFTAVVFRYGLARNLPDGFDFARYLQGIAIMWGLSVATWHRGHISVDLLWEVSPTPVRRVIDIFASILTAGFFGAFAWQMFLRLQAIMSSGQVTADLRLAIWPFYLAGVCGAMATALVAIVLVLRAIWPDRETSFG